MIWNLSALHELQQQDRVVQATLRAEYWNFWYALKYHFWASLPEHYFLSIILRLHSLPFKTPCCCFPFTHSAIITGQEHSRFCGFLFTCHDSKDTFQTQLVFKLDIHKVNNMHMLPDLTQMLDYGPGSTHKPNGLHQDPCQVSWVFSYYELLGFVSCCHLPEFCSGTQDPWCQGWHCQASTWFTSKAAWVIAGPAQQWGQQKALQWGEFEDIELMKGALL